MNNEIDQELLRKLMAIRDYCQKNCKELERWPSYFDRRYFEFLSYLEVMPQKRIGKVLELGCGVGYQSAFLAQIAESVVATDLPEEDMTTHTPGMLQANKLHKELNIHNVVLIGCSAESLPFPDESFDMVYSSHVLEHIPQQELALKEIYRVLKPGGIQFCVVPTSFEKVYSLLNYYLYLGKRTAFHLFKKIIPGKKNTIADLKSNTSVDLKNSVNAQLKYFPFPPPHGHSPNFITELRTWTPAQWRRKIENAAPFQLIHQSTTQINPFMPFLGGSFPVTGTAIHGVTRTAERKMGNSKLFQTIGINTVLIFQKLIS